MHYELRKLSVEDGLDIYEMLQEIPKDENGFINGCNGRTFDDFKGWLARQDRVAQGVGLETWMVPQNTYWLFVDGTPVGFGKLRHWLTDKLREEGGHAGYAVRPVCRGKGYGKLLLKLLLAEAKTLGISKLLLTVQNHNTSSIRVALANDGQVEKTDDVRHFIWIDC